MSREYPQGWYAEESEVADRGWFGVLQLDGYVAPLEDGPWFASEQACLDWLRNQVVGEGMLPEWRGRDG